MIEISQIELGGRESVKVQIGNSMPCAAGTHLQHRFLNYGNCQSSFLETKNPPWRLWLPKPQDPQLGIKVPSGHEVGDNIFGFVH